MNENTLNLVTRHKMSRPVLVSVGGVEYPSTGFRMAKDKIVIQTEEHQEPSGPFVFGTTEEQANSFYADVQEDEYAEMMVPCAQAALELLKGAGIFTKDGVMADIYKSQEDDR